MKIQRLIKNNESAYFIVTISIVSILRMISYSATIPYSEFGDSWWYINFPIKELFEFKLLSGRPFLYPVIINLCKEMSTTNSLELVVLIQIIVSFIAVIFFYKLLSIIINNKIIVSICTIFYGSSNAIIGWDKSIMTESLALSGCVIFIYLMFKYINKPNKWLAISLPIYTLVLTFLRSTFLMFMTILLIFWVIRLIFEKSEKKIIFYGIATSVGTFIVILLYAYNFSLTHEIFSISDAKVRQDLFVSIVEGYYKDCSDKEYVEFVDSKRIEVGHDWNAMEIVLKEYGNKRIAEYNKEARNKNLKEYGKYILRIAYENYNEYFFGYDMYKQYDGFLEKPSYDLAIIVKDTFMQLKFYHIYLIIILEIIINISYIIKNKKIHWIHMGLMTFNLLIILSTFIATCGEFMRTAACVLPFAYISIAIYINKLINYNKSKRIMS